MIDMRRLATVTMTMAVFLCARGGDMQDIEYSCNPSGSITVTNYDYTTYVGAFAKTSDGEMNCTTYIMVNIGFIFINDCPTSRNISLYLLQTSELPSLITQDIEVHTIRCQQIPATGVMRLVTDNSWVTVRMPSTSTQEVITPRIVLNTQIEDIETGVKREIAKVGEALLWDIEGPEGYIVLPTNCTVTSGLGGGALVIVINGCSQDTYLLEHFEYRSETEKHILDARLYAFRFADSTEIVITCDMLGCHNASTACDFTCGSNKRRRRNPFDDHVRALMEKQSTQQIGATQESDGARTRDYSLDFAGQVRTWLTVLDIDEALMTGGSHRPIGLSVMIVCANSFFLTVLERWRI